MGFDWKNLYKIKLTENGSGSMSHLKHEIVKTVIVSISLHKHKHERRYIEIYTEHPIGEGKVCDVFFKNNKNGENIHWEIQKNCSKKWLEDTKKFYNSNNLNWELIDLNKISDDIKEMRKQLEEVIL